MNNEIAAKLSEASYTPLGEFDEARRSHLRAEEIIDDYFPHFKLKNFAMNEA